MLNENELANEDDRLSGEQVKDLPLQTDLHMNGRLTNGLLEYVCTMCNLSFRKWYDLHRIVNCLCRSTNRQFYGRVERKMEGA